MQYLFEERDLTKPTINSGSENKDAGGKLNLLAPIATANIKHSPTVRQISIKTHTKDLPAKQFLLSDISGFPQKKLKHDKNAIKNIVWEHLSGSVR